MSKFIEFMDFTGLDFDVALRYFSHSLLLSLLQFSLLQPQVSLLLFLHRPSLLIRVHEVLTYTRHLLDKFVLPGEAQIIDRTLLSLALSRTLCAFELGGVCVCVCARVCVFVLAYESVRWWTCE